MIKADTVKKRMDVELKITPEGWTRTEHATRGVWWKHPTTDEQISCSYHRAKYYEKPYHIRNKKFATLDEAIAYAMSVAPLPKYVRDVLPPEDGESTSTEGWDFNEHREYEPVFRGWSKSNTHGSFYDGAQSGGSQKSCALFSSKELALEALIERYEELHVAKIFKARKYVDGLE